MEWKTLHTAPLAFASDYHQVHMWSPTSTAHGVVVSSLLFTHASAFVALPFMSQDTTAFDGQYIAPSTNNTAVEWWYAQAIAEPEGSSALANIQILFYQGYPILVPPQDPSQPEYYITIDGSFPNGTVFNFNIPASSGNVVSSGEDVTGHWGDAGSFSVTDNLSSFTAKINSSALGVTGNITMTSRAPYHFPCNGTNSPYFDSAVPSNTSLTPAEQYLFDKLGWTTTIPGGNATVSLDINGTLLQFAGSAYHDANWLPAPLNEVVNNWYFVNAAVGPFDLSGVLATAINSTRQLSTGFLAESGVILQNQCSLAGSKPVDNSTITLYGETYDLETGVNLQTGLIISYALENGDEYSFNLTSLVQNPDQIIYHRWIGTASGGKIGGTQYEGMTVFEWLNPGLNTYTPTP
ncbi:hypothetical protein WOLCODRAFT_146536 [Wolfiporia cocos MD-104 SS10]|uniref:AttH domain-containing protein n=1 Tax=Wolfiporia cocos (strain MD-104) TaxID=742152 RepID=A0A2H3J4E2_WOLCO|nr:hypothetical protein WOLCODRAFT_146536 [Wolfiporia cocos MD-104 SS10]